MQYIQPHSALNTLRTLARLIENSQLIVVPKAGHCVMPERPHIANKALEKFIYNISLEIDKT